MDHPITREIGIDAGHRVTHHGSKCRNLHGHRYTVQATCIGPLFEEGEQEGMTLDFGFLKEEMMREIDAPCDHGLILWNKDPLLATLGPQPFNPLEGPGHRVLLPELLDWKHPLSCDQVAISWAWEGSGPGGKLYVVPFVPTAENLARHWFHRLAPAVRSRSGNQASLWQVRVFETPNCWADFPKRG